MQYIEERRLGFMVYHPFSKDRLNTRWKILVIDNDEEDFIIVRELLKEAKGRKIDVYWASTMEQGREELSANHYDAVLVDYDLGSQSGIVFIREVNERGYVSPLILFTGRGSYEVDVEAMQAGATMYLTKGEVNPLLLERAIRYAIEMKQKEHSLRKSEATLRRIDARWNAAIESINVGVIIATEDEQVIYWNPAARAMHSFTHAGEGIEPLEKTPLTFELWTPDGSHQLALEEWPMRRIKRGEPVRNLDLRIRRPDQGWEKFFSYSGTMVDTAGGERLIFLTCQDLTEQRHIGDALRESEQRQRIALDTARMVAWEYDPATLKVRFSENAEEVLELPRRYENSDQGYRMIHPDDVEKHRALVSRVIESGGSYVSIYRHPHPEKVIWLEEHGRAIVDPAGRTVRLVGVVQNVTERQQAEGALKEREALLQSSTRELRAILDAVPAYMWITHDPQCREMWGNAAVYELERLQPGDNLSKTGPGAEKLSHVKNMRNGVEIPHEELPMQRVAATGLPLRDCELDLLLEDGDVRHLLGNVSPLLDENGQPAGAVSAFIDITPRKTVQRKLEESERVRRESNERFRVTLASAPITVYTTDCDLRITWIHDYHPESDPQGMLGLRFDQVIPNEYGKRIIEIQQAVIASGQAQQGELEAWLEGRQFYYTYYIDPIRGVGGEVTGLACSGFDITGRRQTEQALAEREQVLEIALSSANAGAWSWDLVTDTVIWSDEYYRIFGFAPGEIEPSLKAVYERIHPEDRGSVKTNVLEAVSQGKKIDETHRVTWPDGSIHWVRALSQVFYDSHGKPLRMAGIALDVTLQKQEQETLARYAEQLAQSNQELEQFAFVASHDLQEPLRKIILFGKTLQSQAREALDEPAIDTLGRMQSAAERMQAMINGLLELSRVSRHGRDFQPVDLNKVVADVLSDLEAQIRLTNGRVEVGGLPGIAADEMQMRRLFQNLLGNAIKFHRPGVPPVVRISGTLHPARKPAMVEIAVEDNGIGFEPEQSELIFQPFKRLHGRSEYEGTGLGLAICQKIVERHHGKIEVRSTPGKGTIFIVHLPVDPAS